MQDDAARVPVFVNASAGTAATDLDVLRRAFGADVTITAVHPLSLHDTIARMADTGVPVIGVAGGDGTLRTAARALLRRDTALLCIPTGTLNNFARRHGITDLASSVAALRAGVVRAITVGTIQDDCFLNTLTFGEYSRIVRMRERFRRYVGKWPGAAVAFVVALFTLRRMTLQLTVGEHELVRRTPFLWVGVGYGSFPRVYEAPERRSQPDLEIAVLKSSTKRSALAFVLRLGWGMARGRGPLRDPELEVLHTREFELHRSARVLGRNGRERTLRIDATADGEVLRVEGPVRVGVLDGGLRVLAAPGAPAPAAPRTAHGSNG